MSIKKIAEITGSSPATVSRVLSDPQHKCVSEEKRQKILDTARKIGYVPNREARLLKSGNKTESKIYRIYILMTRGSLREHDPFFTEMLRFTETEIRKNFCMVAGIQNYEQFSDDKWCQSSDIEALVKDLFVQQFINSDGLIIIGRCNVKVLKALKKYEKNIVSINRNSTNYEVDEILCDGKKIAMKAISHLIKLGHRKIGYVGDCHGDSRFTGFQSAQLQFQFTTEPDYIFDTVAKEINGYNAMEYFSKLRYPPTGIYCSNDILAIGMLKFIQQKHNRHYTPSIISSDDIDEAQYTVPMLTTVAIPKEEMAHFAVMLLLDRINGGHRTATKIETECSLIIRGSCFSPTMAEEPEYYI